MKDDVISRRQAIDALHAEIVKKRIANDTNDDMLDEFDTESILRKLPSVQPEQKRGQWLPDNRPGGGFWVCSECKFPSEAFAADVLYKFCPNCGADMRGET